MHVFQLCHPVPYVHSTASLEDKLKINVGAAIKICTSFRNTCHCILHYMLQKTVGELVSSVGCQLMDPGFDLLHLFGFTQITSMFDSRVVLCHTAVLVALFIRHMIE